MSRIHALRGVRGAAIPLALLVPAGAAGAQDKSQVLPPVTVEAPRTQQPRVVRRSGARIAAATARRPTKPPPAREPRIFVPVAMSPDQTSANSASLGPPAAVTRFQLPQESFGINARQIE